MTETINYGNLMHNAMRGLIADLLREIGETGLPGEHHFFITFDTTFPGVEIGARLQKRYPDEMTIVVQHWFENLEVEDRQFGITLNFGDQAEPLIIPFDAIKTFVDPSVEFGLRFDASDDAAEAEELPADEPPENEAADSDAEVVSLDSFRK